MCYLGSARPPPVIGGWAGWAAGEGGEGGEGFDTCAGRQTCFIDGALGLRGLTCMCVQEKECMMAASHFALMPMPLSKLRLPPP